MSAGTDEAGRAGIAGIVIWDWVQSYGKTVLTQNLYSFAWEDILPRGAHSTRTEVIQIRIQPIDRRALAEAALGVRKCDLVIENARIVNLFSGEIYPGSVGIFGGFIAHVQADPDGLGRVETPLQGTHHLDAQGQFLIPGLIDEIGRASCRERV